MFRQCGLATQDNRMIRLNPRKRFEMVDPPQRNMHFWKHDMSILIHLHLFINIQRWGKGGGGLFYCFISHCAHIIHINVQLVQPSGPYNMYLYSIICTYTIVLKHFGYSFNDNGFLCAFCPACFVDHYGYARLSYYGYYYLTSLMIPIKIFFIVYIQEGGGGGGL